MPSFFLHTNSPGPCSANGVRRTSGAALLVGLIALAMASPALASNRWTVCDYVVETVRIDPAGQHLTVKLIRGRSRPQGDCPRVPAELSFRPETADYQSDVPRKRWPAKGARWTLRYRYLDGECKYTGPCRIQHHSLMK